MTCTASFMGDVGVRTEDGEGVLVTLAVLLRFCVRAAVGEGIFAVLAGWGSALSLFSRSSTVILSGTFNSPVAVRFSGAMMVVDFGGESV